MKNWNEFIELESKQSYYQELMLFLNQEYEKKSINPSFNNIFKAFELTPLDEVKVVILGQDPYPNKKDAIGLAFSIDKSSKLTKSLVNIMKELEDDLGIKKTNGDLTSWAKNGVLLLNTILTVEENKPMSHKNKGWEIFTDHLLEMLDQKAEKIVFILWGNPAIAKGKILSNPNHLVITSSHPSPLGAYKSFFGSKPFSKTIAFLGIDKKIWE